MANFGDSFWGGANAGASMASKWVSTYNTGVDRRKEEKFREGAAAIESDWGKARERAAAATNEAERDRILQDARTARSDAMRNLAYTTKGYEGVDLYGKDVLAVDNSNKMVNNGSVLDDANSRGLETKKYYASKGKGTFSAPKQTVQASPTAYGNNQASAISNSWSSGYNGGASAMSAVIGAATANKKPANDTRSLSLLQAAQDGDGNAMSILNRVANKYGGATFGFGKNGMPEWGPEGKRAPMDMEAYVNMGNQYFGLADSLDRYMSK